MDRQRILFAIGFIIVSIIIGILLYVLFFRVPFGPGQGPASNTNGTLPNVPPGTPGLLTNRNEQPTLPQGFRPQQIDPNQPSDFARGGLTKVIDYGDAQTQHVSVGKDGVMFYDPRTGYFETFKDGVTQRISEQVFYNVESVAWAPNAQKAILEYPDGSNIMYDFATKKQVTLPREMKEFSFMNDGTSIVSKWSGTKKDDNWLVTAKPDGSNLQLVELLGEREYSVQVAPSPDGQIVAFTSRAANTNELLVTPLGAQGEDFTTFTVDGLNFEGSWAPDKRTLVYSVANSDDDYRPRLYLTSGDREALGTSNMDLSINTWPSKCTFDASGDSLFCAVPTDTPRGAGLQPEVAKNVPDVFYRVDINTGRLVPLAVPIGAENLYTAERVFLSSDESLLYFVDGATQRLHSIRLK